RATPQNIVIGGAAGAAPPVLGWTAVAGSNGIEYALLLFLIVFIWTPPHFWALAIHRKDEYKKAEIPMLPVTHGTAFTRIQILLYTVLLFLVTMLPYLTGMSGVIYLICSASLGLLFLGYSIKILLEPENTLIAFKTFKYSINYLLVLFVGLLVDHYLLMTF
ncbi:MAG: UbiA family prenyltransferase, partial [Candidatus Thioglobus sp.]|nr:UbiA family prenyltransferase [Candidatus Thioglobus sp.]